MINEAGKRVFLKDDSEIFLRPIRHSDAEQMLDLFDHFSEETIYQRFFEDLKTMTREELERYLNVDYKKDMAIIAETKNGGETFLGVGRYMAYGKNTAEFAVVVRDDWQKKGVGKALLEQVILAAKENGFKKLFGIVMEENAAMLGLLESLGLKLSKSVFEPGVLKIEFEI